MAVRMFVAAGVCPRAAGGYGQTVPAQQPGAADKLRIAMIEVAADVDPLVDELTAAGHDVSIRGRADPLPPEPPDVLHAFGWNAIEALAYPLTDAATVAS